MSSRAAAKKVAHKAQKPPAKAHKGAPKLVKVAAPKKPPPKPAAKAAPAKKGAPQPVIARRPPPEPLVPPPAKKTFAAQTPTGGTPAMRVEPPKQSLARSFYWSELRIGDDLPPLSKPPIDRVQVARYAAASSDFNRLHLDEPFAQKVGFPGVFAPGMLPMGFVSQLLTSWLRRGHVRRMQARFVKIVWPGDEITCRGRIADLRKEQGGCYADVELWAENQKGELVLRGQATCELYESPASGGGDGSGLLFGGGSGPGKLSAQARPAAQGTQPKPPIAPPKKK